MEPQSPYQQPFPVPVPVVLFLGSFATVGEPPSSVVLGTSWRLLGTCRWSWLSQAGHLYAFFHGSINIIAGLETVLEDLAAAHGQGSAAGCCGWQQKAWWTLLVVGPGP